MAERTLEEDFEGRPAKKARLELPVTDLPGTPIDDMDDASIYGTPSNIPSPQTGRGNELAAPKDSAEEHLEPASLEVLNNAIPGLGLLGSSAQEAFYQAPTPEVGHRSTSLEAVSRSEGELNERLVVPEYRLLGVDLKSRDTEGAMDVEKSIEKGDGVGAVDVLSSLEGQVMVSADVLEHTGGSSDSSIARNTQKRAGAPLDPEFLQAAEANRSDENAEWQFDSSDAKSSSSTSSDDSGSSDDSEADSEDEDDYQLLGPEEQAKILMQGDDGSDNEGGNRKGKSGSSAQLRTRNEIEDAKVAKPDTNITTEMKIEELGEIDKIVGNLVLVKAKVSGEYQVLDSGSLLCFEDRRVMGVVHETLGRVQQPLYSVAFNSAAEIVEDGVTVGTKVFYVEQHSSYVFTQPLKAMKGSDASNLHDEEVGEDEMEFSDDEAEAEHRRRIKLEKQSMRDTKNSGNGLNGRPRPKGGWVETSGNRGVGGIQEENVANQDVDGDDLYTPLTRPTNLHELMGKGEATLEARSAWSSTERGTPGARGRDRGRGGRVGRAGRGERGGRGGRGGEWRAPHDYRQSNTTREHFGGQDSSPPTLQFRSNANTFNNGPQSPTAGISYFSPQQQIQYSPQHSSPQFQQPLPTNYEHQSGYSWPQPPISPQYPFAFFPTPQGYHPQSPGNAMPSPGGTLPPGSFVNPAFFRNQQHTWVQHQQPMSPLHQQSQSGAGRMSPEAEAAFKAAQERLDILKELSGVSGPAGRGPVE
ncbi:hypothetical protein FGG08_006155 [Glutinoglossum americanum]|uniref:H/ACA ribonucleoprotein complex non-core subunit NAF1 n=1 Tax=Glutinoglossum americanum TaxID=1670608 RepID=A0A9P8L282_9PEZI|nr:hypothetical protein FGG08_006155 [Glutinoglossum americanum]